MRDEGALRKRGSTVGLDLPLGEVESRKDSSREMFYIFASGGIVWLVTMRSERFVLTRAHATELSGGDHP